MEAMPDSPVVSKRHCVICNSSENRLLFRQSFSSLSNGSSLLSGYDVVVCSHCGFCFADQIPEQATFDAYYRDMSKYEKAEQAGQDTAYEQARFQKMANVITRFLPSPKLRILEIGCANGQLLALIKKQGFENVSGIDPSPVSAETARRYYDVKVTENTLSSVVMEDGTVDFLILAGVLEHVRELIPALGILRRMLARDGKIFISVPDASRYAEGKDAPFQEFSVEHINFFGSISLTNLFRANGFRLVSIQKDSISSNLRTTTPVIHAVLEKNEDSDAVGLENDTETEAGLNLYISQSGQIDKHIQDAIEKIVSAGKPIIIWGTGAHTLRLLATSALSRASIRAFVDSNPRYQGKEINAVPIISPQVLTNYSEPILISSRVFQEEIVAQITEQLGLKNPIIKLYGDKGS